MLNTMQWHLPLWMLRWETREFKGLDLLHFISMVHFIILWELSFHLIINSLHLLYIYDPVEATDRQIQHNHQLDGAILLDLHEMLREHHPHAPLYKQAYEIMRVSVFVFI